MASRDAIAIGITRRRLCAVVARWDDAALSISRVLARDLPEDLARDEPEALGAWLAELLETERFPRGDVLLGLSREQLGLKRISLPSKDPAELPEMTRFAMQRELPFDASDAVIDYLPVAESDDATVVLAVAVPKRVMDDAGAMLDAAGRRARRVSLRAMGVAALTGSFGADPEDSTLAIDVTGDSIEFSVIIDGVVRFSRAAEVGHDRSSDAFREAVSTETRRTWMSYRIVESAADIARVVVIGPTDTAKAAADAVGAMLNVPAAALDYHPMVRDEGHELGSAWPLAGLLLESARGRPSIDFAHPRRPPDVQTRARRLALVGVGAAIVVLAAAFTLRSVSLARTTSTYDRLAGQYRQMIPQRIRYKRDLYMLEHLDQWQTVRVDWLEHLAELAELTPPPQALVLDEWNGGLDYRGVRYDRRERTWSAPKVIRISIEGETRDRSTADAFRAALVEGDLYQATTSSPDAAGGRRLPFSFTYTLTTEEPAPPDDEVAPGDQAAPGGPDASGSREVAP